ncbi:hypothetical protein [Clostridium thailandense]|uniref:Uncharacterized protein n=1 Tax=Clostridium thailandense TaxID=2794346 RepID=A0A949TTY3_9CLOT|nr:hypothetical protein [Clostridium thailandense]MBV7275292.1 hypothetical protein [Clostridium thailandense]MCH5135808.1 hypothetical protein [Clostridiaceae bacterium UIB06]
MSDKKEGLKQEAREMLLDGETADKIKEKTHLRQKDIKRVQEEITKHF